MLALSAGGVTITSNPVAGCALWSWKWKGAEFVNVRDYGREIQAAFVVDAHDLTRGNPTEAGSVHSEPLWLPDPATRQGSPCLSMVNSSATTQSTRAAPLEWQPEFFGGDTTHAIVWRGTQLGKEITLDYAGMGPVARYTTVVTLAAALPRASLEIPAVYVNARLSRFYRYDAGDQALAPLLDVKVRTGGTRPPSGFGGLIVATPDGGEAFGLYGVSADHGGSVTRGGFQYMRSATPAETTYDATSRSVSKINALHGLGLPAGTSRFNTYLMSGTLESVEADMRRLFLAGAR